MSDMLTAKLDGSHKSLEAARAEIATPKEQVPYTSTKKTGSDRVVAQVCNESEQRYV